MKKHLFTIILLLATLIAWSQPTITSFSPTSGSVGTSVTIIGTNFNAITANNVVFFGPTMATITNSSSTSLTVTVPIGATSQKISVIDITTGFTAYSSQPFIPTFYGGGTITNTSFDSKADFTMGNNPSYLGSGDLDGDGKPDIVIINSGDDVVSILQNTSNYGSIAFAKVDEYPADSGPTSVTLADFDGDGKLDFIVLNYYTRKVNVFRNTTTDGIISFEQGDDMTTGVEPYSGAVGDLNNDGLPDFAFVNASSNNVNILVNTSTVGEISFSNTTSYTTGSYPTSIALGDIDGDTKLDIVVANVYDDNVSIYRNIGEYGSFEFDSRVNFSTGSEPMDVAIADLDGDGKPEIITANHYYSASVLRNKSTSGTISFAGKVTLSVESSPTAISIDDVDGDGKLDIAIANYDSNNISILKNKCVSGTISFEDNINFSVGTKPSYVLLCDLNLDGKLDLTAVNRYANSISIYKNNIGAPTIPSTTISEIELAETANSSEDVIVTSSALWTASTDVSWLTISPITSILGDGTITVTAEANPTSNPRTAFITLETFVGTKTILVTQAAGVGTDISSINNQVKKQYKIINNTIFIENDETTVYSISGIQLSQIGNKSITLPQGVYIINTPSGSDKILLK